MENEDSNAGKWWKLETGCHRDTITSRDTDVPRLFASREEAIKDYEDTRKFLHSIGYKVWFATLTSPDGQKICLESNPYRR
jgi:hypothetical protein